MSQKTLGIILVLLGIVLLIVGVFADSLGVGGRHGFGWKQWSREEIYQKWGLYQDYRIRYLYPKAAPVR